MVGRIVAPRRELGASCVRQDRIKASDEEKDGGLFNEGGVQGLQVNQTSGSKAKGRGNQTTRGPGKVRPSAGPLPWVDDGRRVVYRALL